MTKTCPLVLLPLLAAACGSSPPPGPAPTELKSDKVRATAPAVSAEDAAALADGNLGFAVDMHLALRTREPGNFIFSQTSISIALAMLYAGAGTTTAAQMATALHFTLPADRLHPAFDALDLALTTPPPGSDAAAFRLKIANSIWVQDGFPVLPSYLDTLAVNYGAGMFSEDFETNAEGARKAINAWVSDGTEAQIPELFPKGSIDSSARLVLANAVFFHGDWKKPFPHNLTGNAVFHAPAGDVMVPTMHGQENAGVWTGPGWSAAALDYVGDTTSMIIVVPDEGTFDTFEGSLTASGLSAIFAGAQPGGADLIMPLFKFETLVPLTSPLSDLGMPEAFSSSADFSGIDGARDLAVQGVLHDAIISVDEKGTTAAAATGVVVGTTSVPPQLVVNRPFLFFIRHNPTGAILFQGRVIDPLQ